MIRGTEDHFVTAEEISPAINKFYKKLTDIQWAMIKHGVWDSDLQAVCADMIAEIIQTVSAHIVKTALPAGQRQMTDQESQTDEGTALGKMNLSLGDALSASIARALNIPQEACDGPEELTQMIEEEIIKKVHSAVSLLVEKPELRPFPAVYDSVNVADIKKLGCMVSETASYLKRCAGLLSLQEIGMPPIGHRSPTEGQRRPSSSTNREKEPSEMTPSAARRTVRHFMFLLFIRAFERLKKSFKKVQNDDKILDTVYSLIDLVLYKFTSAESLTVLQNNMDDINKALIYRLFKKYGSPRKLLTAALKQDSSFGKSLLKHLKLVIELYLPPKKPKVGSCFSAVKTAFMKLFCCKSTENQDLYKQRYKSWSSSSETSQESSEITPYVAEEILTDFIFLLFLRAFEKSKKFIIRAQNGEKILGAMDSLIDLMMRKVTSAESLRVLDKHMNNINKAISNRLFKEFGSPHELLNAALTENSSFVDTLVKHLEIVLEAYSPPKKTRIAVFLSAVGKAFRQPFSCCC